MTPHAKPKALFLTDELPFPAIGSRKLRETQVIQLLAERTQLELLCFGTESFKRRIDGIEVTSIQRPKPSAWSRPFSSLRPPFAQNYHLPMERELRQRSGPDPQLLWVSSLAAAPYIAVARECGFRVVLDKHHVESTIDGKRWWELPKTWQSAWYESRYCERSDQIVAASDLDACRLRKLAPGSSVLIIPNAVDCASYETSRQKIGTSLLFSGRLNYRPNIEGLRWFLSEVAPRLRAALGPKMPKVVVAGSHCSPAFEAELRRSGVELHLDPPSVIPLLLDSAVFFVPVHERASSGPKILEAMAAGRAVVTTGQGTDGLLLTPGRDAWIADQADGFVTAIVRLFREPELLNATGAHAAQTAQTRYDWHCIRPMIDSLIQAE